MRLISSFIPQSLHLCIFASLLLCFSVAAFAQPQQSANFRITKSVLDAGGAPSTSTNFHLTSAFGQPTPIGIASSANFTLYSGFLTPTFAVSPASPIDVVMRRQIALSNDMLLNWSAISGATSYKIYRDVTPTFTPGPSNLLGTSSTNTFTDAGAVSLPAIKYFYIVEAVGGASPAGGPGDGLARKDVSSKSGDESLQANPSQGEPAPILGKSSDSNSKGQTNNKSLRR